MLAQTLDVTNAVWKDTSLETVIEIHDIDHMTMIDRVDVDQVAVEGILILSIILFLKFAFSFFKLFIYLSGILITK